MEKQELYELIERFLDGVLTETERQAVERRMQEDGDFREEVELQQMLRREFSNPKRVALRSMLHEIMEDAPLTPDTGGTIKTEGNKSWLKWAGGAALIVMACVAIWYSLRPAAPSAVAPAEPLTVPQTDTLPKPPQAVSPDGGEQNRDNNSPSPTEEPGRRVAGVINLVPNRSFEPMVNSGMRSNAGITLKVAQPANDTDFTPDANGNVTLDFFGTLEEGLEPLPDTFTCSLFNNRNANSPLKVLALHIERAEPGKATFDARLLLNLPPGLYYFTLAPAPKDAPLHAGRFTVGVAQGKKNGSRLLYREKDDR